MLYKKFQWKKSINKAFIGFFLLKLPIFTYILYTTHPPSCIWSFSCACDFQPIGVCYLKVKVLLLFCQLATWSVISHTPLQDSSPPQPIWVGGYCINRLILMMKILLGGWSTWKSRAFVRFIFFLSCGMSKMGHLWSEKRVSYLHHVLIIGQIDWFFCVDWKN